MPDPPPQLQPVLSVRSSNGEDLINSILPSYYMFRSTISKRLVPDDESFRDDPPTYELSPVSSAAITPMMSPSPPGLEPTTSFPFPTIDDPDELTYTQNSNELWEGTVLANVHKLENLSNSGNLLASKLDVNVTFTAEVCQKGVLPTVIDLSNQELKQGDFIHGYVTIKNNFHEAVPFDMVYIVFEGKIVIAQGPNETDPPVVFKFLNMPDLFALWSYANIDRLVTDQGDPHDWCVGESDPIDGTVLSIDVKRLFQPGVTYKRFFSFRIPDRLLDDNCETHNLNSHCLVLPTLGRAVDIARIRPHEPRDSDIRDFSFMDTFIDYSVSARVIGRAHQYQHNAEKDAYVMVRESTKHLRVIPYTTDVERPQAYETKVNAQLRALKEAVEEKIQTGKAVLESMKDLNVMLPSISAASSSTSLVSSTGDKLRHLYRRNTSQDKSAKDQDLHIYQHLCPHKKWSLTGSGKALGVCSISTPKAFYLMKYVPPLRFRDPAQQYNTVIEIPLDISYFQEGGSSQIPEPKSISCELVVLSIKSRKHVIPVEFNLDMCFTSQTICEDDNKLFDHENFDTLVIRPFKEHQQKLVSLMRKVGFDNHAFRVETLLFNDVKAMAQMQTKYINLKIPGVEVKSRNKDSGGLHRKLELIPWEQTVSSTNSAHKIYTKKMVLQLDLNTCFPKGQHENYPAFDSFSLVPSFQSCITARIYYLRIMVKQKSGRVQTLHVPFTIYE